MTTGSQFTILVDGEVFIHYFVDGGGDTLDALFELLETVRRQREARKQREPQEPEYHI